jgi:hypothetical protein
MTNSKAYDAARYLRNPAYYKAKAARSKKNRPRLTAYTNQKNKATKRGIKFLLTFAEWLEWWGDDLYRRGRKRNDLQMCRFDDAGHYELGNIYKGTQSQNYQDRCK